MLDAPENTGLVKNLSKEQKIGFCLLLVFAVMAVGLGFLQIRNTFYAPFALTSVVPSTLKNDVNTPDALRYRDTDHDELNDFDELYVYGTSPYLYDTFSYGMSDKQVIAKGLALCPKGQCTDATIASSAGVVSSSIPVAAEIPEGLTPAALASALQDPAQIRAMLIQAGVKEADLQKVSDKDLLATVAEAMSASSTVDAFAALKAASSSTKP
jgi:hypothetical protein